MPRHPNILILLLDTARAQNFSCYGYNRSTTPHLDAIAAEGVLYEAAIAPGCWSLPSQVSLLTGLFPSKHGAHELHLSYAHPYPMLPEVLQEAGYHTLGVSPNSWMSDEFGVAHGFDTYLKLWQGWHTMPASPDTPLRFGLQQMQKVNRLYSRYIFPRRNRARHVTQHVRRLLASTPEPFFLYAIYWDMHLPYHPYGHQATRWLPPGVGVQQAQQVNRNHLTYLTGQAPMTKEDFAVLLALYDGALATIDAEIGTLVALLRQRGILDRTLLIVTSDHGENIGEHDLMSHAYSLHDTLIRVPLLIRYPDRFARRQRVTQQVQLTDLFPTILDLLRIDRPDVSQELQGVSLLQHVAEERFAYAEMLGPHPSIVALNRRAGLPQETPWPAFDRALRCLRTPETKVIWASNGEHALYDLRLDPEEITNRLDAKPELAATLLDALSSWQPPTGVPLRASPPEISPDARQRLRDLGYID
jgi:arylsulfatase A-like enzyme